MKFIVQKPEAERRGPNIPAVPLSDFDRKQHYWEMICGHMADLDTDAVYRTQDSPRKKLWCDQCGTWRTPKPKPKREPYPMEPMF